MGELIFRAASACEASACTLVAIDSGRTYVKDSKLGDQSPVLSFRGPAWTAFLDAVKSGEIRP